MEINLVTLSAGNSRLAVANFIAGEIDSVTRTPLDQRQLWSDHIAEAWKRIEGRENAAIVAASVNPAIVEILEHVVDQVAARRIVWVGKDLDLPFKVRTENPEQTGVDRVLNVAAAYELLGGACMVVDAGTAITMDCCNQFGSFVGGAIAPGVEMILQTLHEKTAALPLFEFEPPVGAYGKSTRQAICHGIYHGARGMVKELAELYATELGQWPEVIATGGDAQRLFGGWELIHAISPDLTLHGIALAYANHHIKHGM